MITESGVRVGPGKVLWALVLIVLVEAMGACSGANERASANDPGVVVPDPDPIPDPDPNPDPCVAPTINFSESDAVVNGGDYTTLTWST
ncbi:MAG: hypothetical protein O7G86_15300, partial [Gammaproteobacteria bacterium]|nr:hypothetical protein [Gammaproteobacteria bacterium]